MISHNNVRVKKSTSLLIHKDNKQNKENCSVNIQQQRFVPLPGKINKIRTSLGPLLPETQEIQKNFTSCQIISKTDKEDIHLQMKKEYSQLTRKDYSQDILTHLINKNNHLGSVLKNHMITTQLRAKMVDWMIQVLSSYKMSEQCFFRSVRYMDLLFKNSSRKLQVADLHLIGIASMFTAAKYQEIYPLKLSVIYDKICRKKFSKKQILDMEQEILNSLMFELQQVTPYDILCHILYELKTPLEPNALEYLKKVCIYLGKMSMHCPELAWIENSLLGVAVLYIGLKTVEQVPSGMIADDYLQHLSILGKVTVTELLECSQLVLSQAKNFPKQFPNLNNLKKFNNAEYCQ